MDLPEHDVRLANSGIRNIYDTSEPRLIRKIRQISPVTE